MKVYICGPNLRDQSKGGTHVHEASCADLKKTARREPAYAEEIRNEPTEVDSMEAIVRAIYDNGIMEEDADWREYVDDIHVFPCVTGLPDDAPKRVEGEMADEGPRGREAFLKVQQLLHNLADGEDIELEVGDGVEAALVATAALIDAAITSQEDALAVYDLARQPPPRRRLGLKRLLKR